MKLALGFVLIAACPLFGAHAQPDRSPPKEPDERFTVYIRVDEKASTEAYPLTKIAKEVVKRVKKRKKWVLVAESPDEAEVVLDVRRHRVRQEQVDVHAARLRLSSISLDQERVDLVDMNYISESHYLQASVRVLGTEHTLVGYDGRRKNTSLKGAASKLAEELEQYLKDNYWSLVDRRRALETAAVEPPATTNGAADRTLPLPPVSSQTRQLQTAFPLPKYAGHVASYIGGDFEEAPREISSLTPVELEELANAFLAGDRTDAELKAAALVHTEYVLSVAPRPPPDPSAARTNAYHLDLARRYAHAIESPEARNDFLKKWHLAVGYRFHADLEVSAAISILGAGLMLFPNDPELAFAFAAFHQMWGALKREERDLLRAQTIFESLLQTHHASEELDELDIRLAHVLVRLDREDEARSYLRDTDFDGIADDSVAVAAWMVNGELAQRSGDWNAAAVAFQSARERDPGCQVCIVALAHARERIGEAEASQHLVTGWLEAPSRRKPDAWWRFLLARSTEHERSLAELRRDVQP